MKLITIDSSVYLSAFMAQDLFHEASLKFLENVRKMKMDVVLPAIVPLEVSNVLHRRGLDKDKVAQVFSSFYQTQKMRIVRLDHVFSSSLLSSMDQFNLKTADWIIAGTSFHFKSQLVSWDQTLLKQTQGLLETSTPLRWNNL